ncbi:MAG: hypothetical protein DMG21_10900 [Acidobacteria bacterium]|nr:MAG: hypothetical protein DMG21_10900 [Acidobacteriota bacterium]
MSSHGITTSHFAEMLQEGLDRVVFDESGLPGFYDLSLYWNPEKPETVTDSVRQELGLELVNERRPVKVLVIDHFEVPLLK